MPTHRLENYFRFPKSSIRFEIPEIIQKTAIRIRATRQPLETSATKIKVYRANMLIIKQMIVVAVFTLVRLFIAINLLNSSQ